MKFGLDIKCVKDVWYDYLAVNTLAKSKQTRYLLYYWLGSLVTFYALVVIADGNFYTAPSLLTTLLLIDIVFGIIAFVLLVLSITKKRAWSYVPVVVLGVILFFAGLFVLPNAEDELRGGVVDQNEPIECGIHEKCGGGTRKMTADTCSLTTCCQVGEVWVVENIDSCKLKQQEYALQVKSNEPQYIYVQQPSVAIPSFRSETTRCNEDYFGNWTCRTTNY